MEPTFRVRTADWSTDRERLRAVREEVFVAEQGVPLELEWDEIDPQCVHMLAEDEAGQPIGTGRLLPDGHVGRMAVLSQWRGRGIGGALLRSLMAVAAARGMREVVLNAQVQACDFYARHGFVAEGPVFAEAGIPHRCMRAPCA
jgi:predicted GNAT family N-acyltransferase